MTVTNKALPTTPRKRPRTSIKFWEVTPYTRPSRANTRRAWPITEMSSGPQTAKPSAIIKVGSMIPHHNPRLAWSGKRALEASLIVTSNRIKPISPQAIAPVKAEIPRLSRATRQVSSVRPGVGSTMSMTRMAPIRGNIPGNHSHDHLRLR